MSPGIAGGNMQAAPILLTWGDATRLARRQARIHSKERSLAHWLWVAERAYDTVPLLCLEQRRQAVARAIKAQHMANSEGNGGGCAVADNATSGAGDLIFQNKNVAISMMARQRHVKRDFLVEFLIVTGNVPKIGNLKLGYHILQ